MQAELLSVSILREMVLQAAHCIMQQRSRVSLSMHERSFKSLSIVYIYYPDLR